MRPPVNPWISTKGVAWPPPRSSTARVTDPAGRVRSGSYMAGNVPPPPAATLYRLVVADGATVALVHGAWHGAWCWERVVERLDARQVPVVAIDLPGHGDDHG